MQLQEPILLLGKEKFAGVDIRVRVKGGGHIAQIYGMKLAKYGVGILQISCQLFLHDADLAVRKVLKIPRRWLETVNQKNR